VMEGRWFCYVVLSEGVIGGGPELLDVCMYRVHASVGDKDRFVFTPGILGI